MATFTAGSTVTLTLDSDDTVTWIGSGQATITPASGPAWGMNLEGNQTFGPFGQSVTVSVVTRTAGSYTQNGYFADRGAPVYAVPSPVTGGVGLTAGGTVVVQDDSVDAGAGLGRITSSVAPAISHGAINTLRSAIIAAGDTVTQAELAALRGPLARLMRSSLWAKLKVLWVPLGTSATTGALVPIIGSNFSGINLVSGDYSAYTGITGNGSNKAINTNWNPNSVAASWGAGAYITETTPTGVAFGTLSGTNTFCALSTNASSINNVSLGAARQFPGLNVVQTNSTVGQSYFGGYQQTSVTMTGASSPNSNITLLSVNGAFYSSQSIVGFAAWAPVATAAELQELSSFFRNVNLALGRLTVRPSLVGCGDSITAGATLSSPTTTRFTKLVADALKLTEDNQGSNGSTMSDDDNGSGSTSWIVDYPMLRSVGRNPALMTVGLGTNDDQTDVPIASFESDYRAWLAYQFAAGIDPGQVILLSPVAATNALANASVLVQMTEIVRSIAEEFGTIFVDLYSFTLGQSSYFNGDLIHLNEAGHSAVATEILRVIGTTKSEGPLYRAAYQVS